MTTPAAKALRVLLASTNPHKRVEVQSVWSNESADNQAVELIGLDTLGLDIPEPVEDQDTFEGNAQLKAVYYANATGMICLADDSGLEVDALNGEPGVRSARYANADGPRDIVDPANNRLLIQRLADTPPDKRTARFVCAMALANPDGCVLACLRGTVPGQILPPDQAGPDARGRGENGFGYDPLFLLPDRGKTTAELSPDEKNSISHRGQAARLMWQKIQAIVETLSA